MIIILIVKKKILMKQVHQIKERTGCPVPTKDKTFDLSTWKIQTVEGISHIEKNSQNHIVLRIFLFNIDLYFLQVPFLKFVLKKV
jgi:hypothetical protein